MVCILWVVTNHRLSLSWLLILLDHHALTIGLDCWYFTTVIDPNIIFNRSGFCWNLICYLGLSATSLIERLFAVFSLAWLVIGCIVVIACCLYARLAVFVIRICSLFWFIEDLDIVAIGSQCCLFRLLTYWQISVRVGNLLLWLILR